MKTMSIKMVALVAELAHINESRKALEKQEKGIKDEIKSFMGSESLLEAGNYCVLLEQRTRSDLNKDALLHDLGREFIDKYSKKTSYEILSIKSLLK